MLTHSTASLPRLKMQCGTLALAFILFGLGSVAFGHGLWIQSKAVLAQHLLERAWDQSLESGVSQKPWAWADMSLIFRIDFPNQNQSFVVLDRASGEAMAFAPGHMKGTPLPGDTGTSIIAAHRDTHFRILKHTQIGDEIIVDRLDGTRHIFRVEETRIVRADQSGIDPWTKDQVLVLSTCYPFNGLSRSDQRFLVVARATQPASI